MAKAMPLPCTLVKQTFGRALALSALAICAPVAAIAQPVASPSELATDILPDRAPEMTCRDGSAFEPLIGTVVIGRDDEVLGIVQDATLDARGRVVEMRFMLARDFAAEPTCGLVRVDLTAQPVDRVQINLRGTSLQAKLAGL
ncbi:hypothetical protein [Oceanomicrobium pacificus]|uniref:PRC-barrel domain-containing protein n=1 Tax=Oceanomicrobium pacificus TaxID=2692916 RepID=A0A6B0TMW4_9RHOB|nr:hypothetical protein [Oceanomicrobium pacificus]MXU63909.1 hypothetical protein [Oceanomicrobium pacificus]